MGIGSPDRIRTFFSTDLARVPAQTKVLSPEEVVTQSDSKPMVEHKVYEYTGNGDVHPAGKEPPGHLPMGRKSTFGSKEKHPSNGWKIYDGKDRMGPKNGKIQRPRPIVPGESSGPMIEVIEEVARKEQG